jgi:hypothetical protein
MYRTQRARSTCVTGFRGGRRGRYIKGTVTIAFRPVQLRSIARSDTDNASSSSPPSSITALRVVVEDGVCANDDIDVQFFAIGDVRGATTTPSTRLATFVLVKLHFVCEHNSGQQGCAVSCQAIRYGQGKHPPVPSSLLHGNDRHANSLVVASGRTRTMLGCDCYWYE